MRYASIDDVSARTGTTYTDSEKTRYNALLEDCAFLIDSTNKDADIDAKRIVSCKMLIRAIGSKDIQVPIGATQGSMSALGYSQSWTVSNGAVGELYLTKAEKKMLGVVGKLGYSNSCLEG